ncbi:cobalamin adenosyltransferase [Pseudoxanthomonas kalamensis DSM 18571]|uniref:esterase/lipase family protein n=1 Tax=Pseudoxanthomonas kalamensis TaxID=289483 RepID=UPI001391A752|nr:alpha/beta fold hydrolase [Pseudoxanthomonas kalamensis]KAF1711119.1 cobalamin adenosyltransferase [Pseudoxanthomonas kalamensis DSM 18571]
MIRRVLLVHGLLNAPWWLFRLSAGLRAQGFEVATFGYASVLEGPRKALPRLVERLRRQPVEGMVGHSLGGLMALQALRAAPELPVRRVVCLGSPLRGSATARNVAAHAWSRPLLGYSAELLLDGLPTWDGAAEVGMIAGDVARGLGRLFARPDGVSDGTVGLEETRLPGLADHCIVHSSHTGLVFSDQVAAQAGQFLREGRFLPP